MRHEIDIDLIVQALRDRGHTVGNVIPVPDNAGDYEFNVDGLLLSLSETRALLQRDAERRVPDLSGA
jgi:hypothetical protein